MKRHTYFLRICALVCALCLLAPAMAAAELDGVQKSKLEDDGVVRVYLKSLDAPSQLTLTLDGLYTVEHDAGFRFARGTRIVLSDGGDGVWLTVGGLTMDMGAGLTLTRQRDEGENNGMYIAETGYNTFFPGDLSVSREANGGLRAVLSIHVEDYLCGVIAYEMSDAWPLEALKAQAVAARTYAMQRKQSAGTKDYDVVNTTADQVFRGINADYTNVEAAVRATEGVVGVYRGAYASCYYTASNGGETALPSDVWGASDADYGYLARTADPHDLANPNSMVRSLKFTPGATDSPKMQQLLQSALEEVATDCDQPRFEEILSIEPVDPVAEGSIMCRKLRFTLAASALADGYAAGADDIGAPRGADESANANHALYAIDLLRRLTNNSPYEQVKERKRLEECFEVDLDVYDQIKRGFDLGLSASDCEVVSIARGPFDFTIELRRFGHGVGMSQRGAQYMAGTEGWKCEEILAFYYPGMTLERIDWDVPELEAIEALPESFGRARPDPTPTPTPAPLPALKKGEYYACVALGDAGSTMNLRAEPGTHAAIVAQLANGQRVIVSGEEDEGGWVPIATAEYSGYAKLEYLKKE